MREVTREYLTDVPGESYRLPLTLAGRDGSDSVRAEAVGRILVIAWGILGDSVCKLPAIAALRQRYPGARIVVWTDAATREVFEEQPFLDDLWVAWGRGRGLLRSLRSLAWAAAARWGRFDLVVDLYASRHTARLVWLSGARWRTGRNRPVTAWAYNTLPVPEGQIEGRVAVPELFAVVVRHLGADVPATYLPLVLTPAHRERARQALETAGWRGSCPLVLLNPGTSKPGKTWPPDRFGALGRALAGRGVCVVALCNPGAEMLQQTVVEASGGEVLPVAAMPLKTLAAALQSADLLVTGDTGVMHLAMAHGVPSVVLSGATHPVTIAALPHLQTLLFHPEACSEREPAHDCRFQRRCAHVSCIRAITVEEVEQACAARLRLCEAARTTAREP